jgi:hypothetical protein
VARICNRRGRTGHVRGLLTGIEVNQKIPPDSPPEQEKELKPARRKGISENAG